MDKSAILTAITAAFRKEFQTGLESVKPDYTAVAMTIPSNTATNTYAWLGKFPQMREWVGSRQIEKMNKQAMSLDNKKFEATVGVARTDIEDDQVGMYRPMMAAMGESAAALPDTLVWGLLKKGKPLSVMTANISSIPTTPFTRNRTARVRIRRTPI